MATVFLWLITAAIFCSIGCSWQKTSESHANLTMKLRVYVDSGFYNYAKKKSGDAHQLIDRFVRTMLWGAHTYYFAKLVPPIKLESTSLEIWHSQPSKLRHGINDRNISRYLHDLIRSGYAQRQPLVDHTIVLTGYKFSPQHYGITQFGAMCLPEKKRQTVSIINTFNKYRAALVAAHEVAHNIGIHHDGHNSTFARHCSSNNRYFIMHTTGHVLNVRSYGHPIWSSCSQKRFIRRIAILDYYGYNCLKKGPKCNGTVTFVSRAEDTGVHHNGSQTPYEIPGYPKTFRMTAGERYSCACAVDYNYAIARLEISGTNGSQMHSRTFQPPLSDDMRRIDYSVWCDPVSLMYQYESKDGRHQFTLSQGMQIDCKWVRKCAGNVTFRRLNGMNKANINSDLVANLCAINQPFGNQTDTGIFSPESVRIVPGETYYCTCIVNYHNNASGELITSNTDPVPYRSGRFRGFSYEVGRTHSLTQIDPIDLYTATVPYIVKCNPNTGNYEYSVDYKHNGTADVFSCIYHSAQ